MKRNLLIIIWSILMLPKANAQSKSGIESYHFLSNNAAYVWMPVVHHVGKKGFYTEMRYNYEELNTASVYAGKSFSRDSALNFTVTPMLGLVFGKYNGASVALNAEAEYKKIFMSVQTQYTISRTGAADNFFYTWAETGYQPVKWFYAGVSAQLTKIHVEKAEPEYGALIGFNIKKINIPVYIFSPFSKTQNLIIGINAEW